MFANFDYYIDNYYGKKIQTEEEYIYLAQKSCKYIERYTREKTKDTKDCECAICEYLQDVNKQKNITSESIPSAYSVSYATKDSTTIMEDINDILELYLGDIYSSVGIVKIIG